VHRLRLTTRHIGTTVHTAAAVLLAAGSVAACTPDRAPDAAPRAAAPAVAATVATTPPAPASAARAESPPPPAEVRAVCDSVVARWRAIPDASVASIDTVTEARDVDGGNDPRQYPACVVRARREAGLDSTMDRLRFWPAASWTPVWRLDADGPDGNVRTYQRALVRCEVWEQQDGGDDGDSTYVPSPFFGEVTTCWRHRFPVRVTDTLHAEP
jgi:hypothetical protein